jgi:cob(I)alamin adenosyltransferase
MVRIDTVVTRGGDSGETSLGDGARVRKDAKRIIAIGAVDEANATIGLLRLHTPGADLCVPGEAGARLRLNEAPVLRLEQEAAAMNATLPKLTSFILPGGTPGAAYAHVARTAARHAERTLVALTAEEQVNPMLQRYLNRLSDHLFILARVLNDGGKADVLWQPGANRE